MRPKTNHYSTTKENHRPTSFMFKKKKKINAKLQNKILSNKIHRIIEREKVTRNR